MDNPKEPITQREILEAVLRALPRTDAPVNRTVQGAHLVAADCGGRMGLASRQGSHGGGPNLEGPGPDLPESARELAKWLAAPPRHEPQARSLGLAAVNALLPPPENLKSIKGQDLILKHGEGRNVTVVGHFPFVERMGPQFGSLSVLELEPREGDIDAGKAGDVLPRADVVAVTGTTLLNGTLAGLLAHCRKDAFVLLLGPSTPFAPGLFDLGVDALAGAVVDDALAAEEGIRRGLPFKTVKGTRSLIWLRE